MRIVCLLAVLVGWGGVASAQEVTEDFVVNQLGPAAETMVAWGITGDNVDRAPDAIMIMQWYGIDPAFWISPEEARWALRDRDRNLDGRTREASTAIDQYPAKLTLAAFQAPPRPKGMTCDEKAAKVQALTTMSNSLTQASWLNVAGAGLMGAILQGTPYVARFVGPLAVVTTALAVMSSMSGQLATAYRNAPCWTGGNGWKARDHISASHSPGRSPIPTSPTEERGCLCAGGSSGYTSPSRARTSPWRRPSATGSSMPA
jgi:hypothetical protein